MESSEQMDIAQYEENGRKVNPQYAAAAARRQQFMESARTNQMPVTNLTSPHYHTNQPYPPKQQLPYQPNQPRPPPPVNKVQNGMFPSNQPRQQQPPYPPRLSYVNNPKQFEASNENFKKLCTPCFAISICLCCILIVAICGAVLYYQKTTNTLSPTVSPTTVSPTNSPTKKVTAEPTEAPIIKFVCSVKTLTLQDDDESITWMDEDEHDDQFKFAEPDADASANWRLNFATGEETGDKKYEGTFDPTHPAKVPGTDGILGLDGDYCYGKDSSNQDIFIAIMYDPETVANPTEIEVIFLDVTKLDSADPESVKKLEEAIVLTLSRAAPPPRRRILNMDSSNAYSQNICQTVVVAVLAVAISVLAQTAYLYYR